MVDRPDESRVPTADAAGSVEPAARASRRSFLRRAGLSGAALVAGGMAAHELIPHGHNQALAAEGPPGHPGGVNQQVAGAGIGGSIPGDNIDLYGHGFSPPPTMAADALDDLTVAPARDERPAGTVRELDFTVTARPLQIGDGLYVDDAWTYNGTAPGPIIRATEGDLLRITLHNRTNHDHNLHLHGRHSPLMDGWEPIVPGDSFTYEIEAGPAGLHPYHCHTMPLARHIAKGLYGAFIVDPVDARPPAHEFVLVLSGWDTDGDGRNDAYAWNGVTGFFSKFPIKVPAGEPIRLYIVNMLEYEPIASFHLHAQTFDVFRTGTSNEANEHTDTVTMSQGERVIVEFTLPERGRYMFHPHQHHMAERGAMGWFAAI